MSHLTQINFLKYHIKNRDNPEFQEYAKCPDVLLVLGSLFRLYLWCQFGPTPDPVPVYPAMRNRNREELIQLKIE